MYDEVCMRGGLFKISGWISNIVELQLRISFADKMNLRIFLVERMVISFKVDI